MALEEAKNLYCGALWCFLCLWPAWSPVLAFLPTVLLAEEVVVSGAGAVVVGACPQAPRLNNKVAAIADLRLPIQPSEIKALEQEMRKAKHAQLYPHQPYAYAPRAFAFPSLGSLNPFAEEKFCTPGTLWATLIPPLT